MKRIVLALSVLMVLSMLLSACGTAATTAPTTAAPATEVAATQVPATQVLATQVLATAAVPATQAPTQAPTTEVKAGDTVLSRNETLYFNGQQWGTVVCWNPYSANCNNAMAIA